MTGETDDEALATTPSGTTPPGTTPPAIALRALPRLVVVAAATYWFSTGSGWSRWIAAAIVALNLVDVVPWLRYVRTGRQAPATGASVVPDVPAEYLGGDREVRLEDAGDRPIQVIKVVREVTGFGLREAKAIVDGVPSTVAGGLTEDGAAHVAALLAAAGARTSVRARTAESTADAAGEAPDGTRG